jgi:hypothetical protein
MGQEVVLELPSCNKDYIEQILNLRVPCLSILQDFADKVHKLLFDFHRGFRSFNRNNCADNCIGSGTYNSNTSSGFDGTNVGRDFKYRLSSMKVVVA